MITAGPGVTDVVTAVGRPACVNVLTDPSVISPITIAMVGTPRPVPATVGPEKERVRVPYYADLEQE